MPPESFWQYERIQAHLAEQDWADSAREEVSFFGAGLQGFNNAAAESIDSDHLLGTTAKLGFSFGIGLAMARFTSSKGVLGQVAKAGGSAMGLSLAGEVLTKSDEIAAAWDDSSKAGDIAGRFAFDAALMTASGVGGQKLGGRMFAVRPESGMSLRSKEFIVSGIENSGALKIEVPTSILANISGHEVGHSPLPASRIGSGITSIFSHDILHDRMPLDFAWSKSAAEVQPGRVGSALDGIGQHELGHTRMGSGRSAPVAAEGSAHRTEILGGFSKPTESGGVISEVGQSAEWLSPDRPSTAMEPKAYKVLTKDGASPWARDVRWSLPKQAVDGTWIPGEWMQAKPHQSLSMLAEMVSGQPAGNSKVGLYISDNPRIWKNDLSIPGNVVYEVEIGDAASIASWKAIHSGDFASPLAQEVLSHGHIGSNFVAQQVRLRHPVSAADLPVSRSHPMETLMMMTVASFRPGQPSRSL